MMRRQKTLDAEAVIIGKFGVGRVLAASVHMNASSIDLESHHEHPT